MERKLEWRRVLEDRALKINRNKTEYLSFNDDSSSEVFMQGERTKRVRKFKYLGSEGNRELDEEVVHRTQAGWRNW